jgi:hypothetical protein
VQPPEMRQMYRRYERKLERDLKKARPRLFQALQDFANIRADTEAWVHFKKRWPDFFPDEEYRKVIQGLDEPSIRAYPYWLNQIWFGGDSNPQLKILLGIEDAPLSKDDGTPEESWLVGLAEIPAQMEADWDEGVFRYRGACDFQRALYLLFQESWRARICDECSAKFIARRGAQRYCSTECSGKMLRELKRKWWSEHGETWRQGRTSRLKRKDGQNVTHKAR